MSVDPTEPETFQENDAAEFDMEAPEADAAEQRTDVTPRQDEDLAGKAEPVDEADRADQAEQVRVVDVDEDDYRSPATPSWVDHDSEPPLIHGR